MYAKIQITPAMTIAGIEEIKTWDDDSMIKVGSPADCFHPAVCGDQEHPRYRRFEDCNLVLVNSTGNAIGIGEDILVIDSSRGALNQAPSLVAVMEAMGLYSYETRDWTGLAVDLPVLKYGSMRTDVPWWAVGLDHPLIRDLKVKARDAGLVLTPPPDKDGVQARLIFHHGKAVWEYPFSGETIPWAGWTGLEYRRAGAMGINL
ncbi:MAG: hypothetical protein RBR45_14195 [Pseudomonas sp.]|nr:hypothetical protein [Pseudomonas sp.]